MTTYEQPNIISTWKDITLRAAKQSITEFQKHSHEYTDNMKALLSRVEDYYESTKISGNAVELIENSANIILFRDSLLGKEGCYEELTYRLNREPLMAV